MYDPWSTKGVEELKQPTYVMAFIAIDEVAAAAASATDVADENCNIDDRRTAAVVAVRSVDDIVMCRYGCEEGSRG